MAPKARPTISRTTSSRRYANKDESFVFWNKGDTAFITEGASGEETYSDCVAK